MSDEQLALLDVLLTAQADAEHRAHEAQLIAETEQLVDLLYPPKLYTGLYL